MKEGLVCIAVIGLGRMGSIYLRELSSLPDVRLCAADADIASRAALLAVCGVEDVADDAEDLLSREDVDAVVVATPTATHAALVQASAVAGKDLFCEKPLALTLDDTHACLRAVREAGTRLQVGFMRRFDPEYRRAAAWIREGRIGRPIGFHGIGRDRGCPPPAFADPASSGGLVLDMGIHDFDLARWLMGREIVRVSAEASLSLCAELEQIGDVDSAVIALRFEGDAIGSIEVGRTGTYGYDVRTEVVGTKGVVRIGYGDPPAGSGAIGRENSSFGIDAVPRNALRDAAESISSVHNVERKPSEGTARPRRLEEAAAPGDAVEATYSGGVETPIGSALPHPAMPQLLQAPDQHDIDYLMRRFGAAYRAQIRHFVNGLLDGPSTAPGGLEALRAFEIALAASVSARERRPVEIEEVRSDQSAAS